MVSWKIEYEYYKNDIPYPFGDNIITFFETNPTDKQILILDKRETNINIAVYLSFFFGILIGLSIYYLFHIIGG